MKIKFVFLIYVFLYFGCANSVDIYEGIQVVKGKATFHKKLIELPGKKNMAGSDLEKILKDSGFNFDNFWGIAKFEFDEFDPPFPRPFELVLIQLQKGDMVKNFFVTIGRKEISVIDVLEYDPLENILGDIYLHSSEINHEGIYIEMYDLIKSNEEEFNRYPIELLNDGTFKVMKSYKDSWGKFLFLSKSKPLCGFYKTESTDYLIELELKDGSVPKSYCYLIYVTTPIGCVDVYIGDNGVVELNEIKFDSLNTIQIVLLEEEAILVKENYKSGCDENFELNHKLIKKAENKTE